MTFELMPIMDHEAIDHMARRMIEDLRAGPERRRAEIDRAVIFGAATYVLLTQVREAQELADAWARDQRASTDRDAEPGMSGLAECLDKARGGVEPEVQLVTTGDTRVTNSSEAESRYRTIRKE